MKKVKDFTKMILLVLLAFSIIPANAFNTNSNVNAATLETKTISFPEKVGSYQTQTLNIPNFHRVVSVSVDNGTVSTSASGEQVTVAVNNGNYINYSSYWNSTKYSKYATVSKSDSGTCPWASSCKSKEESGMYGSISYNQDGYSGTLYETSYTYTQNPPGGTKPAPAYYSWYRSQTLGGTVYAGGTEYYNYTYAYTVTMTYETNIKPKVTLNPGIENKVISDYPGYSSIDFAGFVEDQDNDTVTIDVDVNGISKSVKISDTKTSKPFSVPFDVVADGLKNGINTVSIYANDGTGRFLVKTFTLKVTKLVEDGKYVLVDELLYYLTKYSDPENDAFFQEQFKYVHDEKYFENDLGLISDTNVWRSTSYQSLNKVGHFKIYYRAMDNPLQDTQFAEFRRWSEPSPALNLYVHRRPVPGFQGYIHQTTGQVALMEEGYDLDKYSFGRKGIKSTDWSYREVGTSTWILGRPTMLNPSKNYEVKQIVWDFQGVSASIIKQLVKTGVLPNQSPVAGFTYIDPIYIGDDIKLTSTAFDPDGDLLQYTYVIKKPTGELLTIKPGNPMLSSNGDVTIKADQHPTDLGVWDITQTVSDGNEQATATGRITVLDQVIDGTVSHTEAWEENRQKYNLGISGNENVPRESFVFFPGEKFMLKAAVTSTAIQVKVIIEEYPQFSTELQLKNGEWVGSLWNRDMLEMFKNETLHFRFNAIYQNGWTSEDVETVLIVDDKYWREHSTY